MDKRMEEILASLDGICTEIVVPLREKVINKAAFSELFELMDELQKLLYNEKLVQKELVEKLFFIYTQLDMQDHYVGTEEVKKEFNAYLTKMRSEIREIFGKRLQQNAGVKEISVNEIIEMQAKSGEANQQEIGDILKKFYD